MVTTNPYLSQLQLYTIRGVPQELRNKIWPYISGIHTSQDSKIVYHDYVAKAEQNGCDFNEGISMDIERTLSFFSRQDTGATQLRYPITPVLLPKLKT